jgi:hypothetical protein
MIDRFDAAFGEPHAPHCKPTRTYDPVPAGVCDLEIVKAERKTVPWKATEKNPTGSCIALRLRASSSYSFVFVDLPDDKPWLAQHVARAVGIPSDPLAVEQLVGLHAHVEVGHITNRNGETRAVVRKWLPSSTTPQSTAHTPTLAAAATAWQADEKRKPPRQPPRQPAQRSRNAPPQIGPDDDIPF